MGKATTCLSVCLCLLATARRGEAFSIINAEGIRDNLQLPYTGISRNIEWDSSSPPVSVAAEQALRDSGVLSQRGEFGFLKDQRVAEIEETSSNLGISISQALSIRRQMLLTQTVHSNSLLKAKSRKLSSLLPKTPILELSVTYDQPPVAIFRAILDSRLRLLYPAIPSGYYKQIVKAVVMEELNGPHLDDLLSVWEQDQLDVARQADVLSYQPPYDTSQLDAATKWEESLHKFLDTKQVHYMTEEALRKAGATRTPDVLLLDDTRINGQSVRWMDCKNYFGSAAAKHSLKSVKKQIRNYQRVFDGAGAIVYKHGFTSELEETLPDTLLLDGSHLFATFY